MRCFRLLIKGRWKILASPFLLFDQVKIIVARCLLHNLIQKVKNYNPQEQMPHEESENKYNESNVEDIDMKYITTITSSNV